VTAGADRGDRDRGDWGDRGRRAERRPGEPGGPDERPGRHRAGGPGGPEWESGAEGPRRHFTEPRSRRPYVLIAGTLTVVLVMAAAALVMLKRGGGDDADKTADSDPLVAAVTKSMDLKGHGALDAKQTNCMTDALINTAGRDHLIEQGVTKGADPVLSLDPANKDAVLQKTLACLDDKTMVAFMAATWIDPVTSKPINVGPCVFKGWMQKLGRDRIVYLYSTFASVNPPSLQDSLNENEFVVVTRILTQCNTDHSKGTSTTATTVAGG
jgi:hypothetical protein